MNPKTWKFQNPLKFVDWDFSLFGSIRVYEKISLHIYKTKICRKLGSYDDNKIILNFLDTFCGVPSYVTQWIRRPDGRFVWQITTGYV